MDEKSTQVKSDKNVLDILMNNKGATRQTLDFIKMVARSYHVEESLPDAINATCMN